MSGVQIKTNWIFNLNIRNLMNHEPKRFVKESYDKANCISAYRRKGSTGTETHGIHSKQKTCVHFKGINGHFCPPQKETCDFEVAKKIETS